MTYFNTVSFAVLLAPRLLRASTHNMLASSRSLCEAGQVPHQWRTSAENIRASSTERNNAETACSGSRGGSVVSVRELAQISLKFCVLWFSANFLVALALRYTTVASSTILASTSGFWTLLLGVLNRVETFTRKKLFAVCLSFLGVILVATSDVIDMEPASKYAGRVNREVFWGDMSALGSAVLYGIYMVLMKKHANHDSDFDAVAFLGFVGVFAALLLWPGLLILHETGLETVQQPDSRRIWIMLIVSQQQHGSLLS